MKTRPNNILELRIGRCFRRFHGLPGRFRQGPSYSTSRKRDRKSRFRLGRQTRKAGCTAVWFSFLKARVMVTATQKRLPKCQVGMPVSLGKDRASLGRPLFIGDQNYGGEGGIRTPGTVSRTPVFKTGAFNHSATSPDTTVLLQRPIMSRIPVDFPLVFNRLRPAKLAVHGFSRPVYSTALPPLRTDLLNRVPLAPRGRFQFCVTAPRESRFAFVRHVSL